MGFYLGTSSMHSQTHGMMWMMRRSQKSIANFNNKQRLLSIDMKTKDVQHVLRIIFKFSKFSTETLKHGSAGSAASVKKLELE